MENLSITAGLRYDYWWNFDAQSVATTGVVTNFPNEGKGAINPRIGLIYRINPELSVRTAGYTGFRAPNLNELIAAFLRAAYKTTPTRRSDPSASTAAKWARIGRR